MPAEPVTGPSVWTAEALRADPSWILKLDERDRADCLGALAAVNWARLAYHEIERDAFPLPSLGARLDAVIDQIEGGRGVTLVKGVPVEGLSIEDCERLFWGLACHIGYPEPQDASGTRLHHVRADRVFTDEATTRAAFQGTNLRAYKTNVELGFHNDGSDALFFLCLRAAESGGLSRIVSVGQAYNAVLASDPEAAALLRRDFDFDMRGEDADGRRVQTAPILADHVGRLSILYKRGYVELAQAIAGVAPLTPVQIRALDAFDAALNDPAHVHDFMMRPGDIQIANNYAVLHSRTTFQDHADLDQKRHMLRVWATLRRNRRPLPPAFRSTREFAATQARRLALGDPLT